MTALADVLIHLIWVVGLVVIVATVTQGVVRSIRDDNMRQEAILTSAQEHAITLKRLGGGSES